MRILVTGGAGFIGSHLTESLVKAGHQVYVLDDLSSGRREYVAAGAELHIVDIRDAEAMAKICQKIKPEVVYHLAGLKNLRKAIDQPVEDAEVNILGSLNVLNLNKDWCKQIIFSSSAAVYGEATPPVAETAVPKPLTPYGIAKLAIEYYLQFFQRQYGIKTCILRFANVYGPRQDPNGEAGVISLFMSAALHNQPLTINGDGSQTRDYIYVSDIVKALIKAMGQSGIYNLGTGVETSLLSVIEHLRQLHQAPINIQSRSAIAGEVKRWQSDWQQAKQHLAWLPEITIEQGMQIMYQWMKNNYQINQ